MKVALIKTARKLRRNTTDAELMLWLALRNRRLNGHKFKRQVPFGPYVADFLCVEAKLIIEADGGQHAEEIINDLERSRYFESQGYRVLRFWNNEILRNLEGVLETIAAELGESPLTQPSPRRERASCAAVLGESSLSPRGEGEIAATVFPSGEVSSRVPSPLGEKDRMRGSCA